MYKLPDTLSEDIARLGAMAKAYQNGQVEPVRFKAVRVPMGIYEQRRDEVYMVRVRTTGGVIHPAQFLRLIDIARQHGSDLLHITTRQEIQLQNLALKEVEPILNELQSIGLSSKGGGGNTVRNILVSPGSGISADEVFDTTPYAMALTTKLIAEPDSYLLPRKMKIAFSSGDTQTDYAAINDLGFVARIRNGQRGFEVYVGGGCGSKPTVGRTLFRFLPEEELFVVAAALKKMFSEHGNRKNKYQARLRYIFYKLGEEETLRLIRAYYEEAKKTTPLFISSPAEEERVATYLAPPSITPLPAGYETWVRRYVIPQRQSGYSSVVLPFAMGNLPLTDDGWVKQFETFLRFVERFGKETLRFTTTQNIRLRNLPDAALPELYTLLPAGLIPDMPAAVNHIVSCTGADTCRLGITFSKGLAAAIRRELLRSLPEVDRLPSLRIHISGCPNSCGQQLWADIGFSGKVLRNDRLYPGYQVHLAADRGDRPRLAETVGNIAARNIPEFVVRLLASYLEVQPDAPSLTEWLENDGRERAVELLAGYEKIPLFEEDKNYYFDWGAEQLFSIVNRGNAECSAGLFDMIELDLNKINAHKKALETETDQDRINRLLYEILYSSAQMLLVTRGAEPRSTADTFRLFRTLFIDSGLVSGEYRSLVESVESAGNPPSSDFISRKETVYALSDAVIELYRNMDDSLQFKNGPAPSPQPVVEQPAQNTPKEELRKSVFKDLRGVACPMNFVHTKMQLAAMKAGEELEIWLDDGPPIENVPGSVRNEGHRVLEQIAVENYWKVIIQKKQ